MDRGIFSARLIRIFRIVFRAVHVPTAAFRIDQLTRPWVGRRSERSVRLLLREPFIERVGSVALIWSGNGDTRRVPLLAVLSGYLGRLRFATSERGLTVCRGVVPRQVLWMVIVLADGPVLLLFDKTRWSESV